MSNDAEASLRYCADSLEPSLFAFTKCGCSWRLRSKFSHQAPLGLPSWLFKGDFTHTVNSNIFARFIFANTCSVKTHFATLKNRNKGVIHVNQ